MLTLLSGRGLQEYLQGDYWDAFLCKNLPGSYFVSQGAGKAISNVDVIPLVCAAAMRTIGRGWKTF